MRTILVCCCLSLAPALAGAAIESDVPILLLMDESAYKLNGGGLIGALVSKSANKTGDSQTEELNKRTAGVDWKELATAEFACFALPAAQEGKCRKVFVVDKQPSIIEIVKEQSLQRVIVVDLLQMFRPASRYRARAVFHDLWWNGKRFDDKRVMTAVYESYVPPTLADGFEKSGPGADEYWAEGSPSKLETDARNSLHELRLLGEFLEPLVVDRFHAPKEWKALPKVKTLEQAGRANCRGTPCGSVHVLDERSGRTWLVYERPYGPFNEFPPDTFPLGTSYGVAAASFDANALLHSANLFLSIAVPQ